MTLRRVTGPPTLLIVSSPLFRGREGFKEFNQITGTLYAKGRRISMKMMNKAVKDVLRKENEAHDLISSPHQKNMIVLL